VTGNTNSTNILTTGWYYFPCTDIFTEHSVRGGNVRSYT